MPTDNHCKAVQEQSVTTQQEREARAAFEAWAETERLNLTRRQYVRGDGDIEFYWAERTQGAWKGFLAGRASLPNSGELVEALTTITQMDPDGVRADDLGRAVGIARAALSAKEPK